MTEFSFKALIEQAKQRDSYWAGKAKLGFTEDLVALMAARGVSKIELARRIGSSPAYVTKVLRGDTNFTIDSMVHLVRALDGQLSVRVARREDRVRWFAVLEGGGGTVSTSGAVKSGDFHRVAQAQFRSFGSTEGAANDADAAAA